MTDKAPQNESRPEPPSPRVAQTPTPVALDERFDGDDRKYAMVYACQMKWESLQPTENPLIRFCNACSQQIFQVKDRQEFSRAVAEKRCVMAKQKMNPAMILGPAYFGLAAAAKDGHVAPSDIPTEW
jgi:hypothetical protein